MIGYVTVGTNDLPRATAYYDALFESIGVGRTMEVDNYFVAWGPSPEAPGIAATIPFNKEPATVGNGMMVALFMETPEKVNTLYHKALELGGTDEGEPGFRLEDGSKTEPGYRPEEGTKGFYAAYFRDLDGNKLNAFCMVE